MSEIPNDIHQAARKLCDSLIRAWLHHWPEDQAVEMAAKLILSERERCLEAVRQVKTDVGVYVRRSDILDAISNSNATTEN